MALCAGLVVFAGTGRAEPGPGLVIAPERWSASAGPCLVAYNQGVDAIAEYRSADGELVLRAGSWLGRDGRYLLAPPAGGVEVTLRTTAGHDVEGGQVDLLDCPAELNVAAVEALIIAQDLRLAAYYGEPADGEAIEQAYELAIEGLAAEVPGNAAVLQVLSLARYETAAWLRGLGRLEEAAAQYAVAAEVFDQLGDTAPLAAAVNALGLVAWRQGKLDLAVEHFEHAIALRGSLGDLFALASIANNLGLIHARRNELPEAVARYESALSVLQGNLDLRRPIEAVDLSALEQPPEADLPLALNTLGNLALVLRQQGQVDLAELYWRNYMALEAQVPSPVVLARARLNFAQLLSARGRLDEALWQLATALNHFEAVGERRWIVEVLSELAELYQKIGDPAGALAHARQAVAIELEDVAAAADARYQLGRLLVFQGDDAGAVIELERAVELARLADSESRRLWFESELVRARFLTNPTFSWLDEQRRIHDQFVALGRPGDAATALARIGEKQLLLGELVSARKTLEQAIEAHRAIDDPLAEVQSLELLGRLLEQLDGTAAIKVNQRAIDVAEGLRHVALPTLRQAELFASLRDVYRRQIRALIEAGRHDDARRVAELARWRNLRTGEPTSANGPGAIDGLLDARAGLLDRMHRLRLDPRSATDSSMLATLGALQRELDGVETALGAMAQARQTPEIRVHSDPAPAELPLDSVLLSYFLLDDRILLWITSSDGTRLEQLVRPEELAADIAALQDWLRHPRRAMGWIHVQAARLGEILLAPAAADLAGRRIVVVQADDILHGLPFGLLPWTGSDDAQPLIESHDVQMVIGQAAFVPQAPTRSPASSLLLIADPGWSDGQGSVAMLPEQSLLAGLLRDERLADLPGSRIEAEAIAARAAKHMPVRLRTGPEASREFILGGGLADYRIIHLATHGLVDLQYPMLSSLLLASENAAGPAFLRPSEIAGLSLSAELVVLSGCETGHGRIVPGSGALSLARPFLGAGAAKVLASLWKIDDSRTARFMDRFYHHLLDESQSPAEALARTQRWTRRQTDTMHPYYWAGFVLLSDH